MSKIPPLARTLVTDSALVAGLTAAVYVSAYLFELGFANTFDIPRDLIVVELADVLATSMALIVTVGLVLILADAVSMAAPAPGHLSVSLVLRHLPIFCVLLFLLLVVRDHSIGWLAAAFALLAIPVLDLVVPLIEHRAVPGYPAKLEARRVALARRRSLLSGFFGLPGYTLLPSAVALLVFLMGATNWGTVSAQRKRTFAVRDDGMLILAIYGSVAVLGDYDPHTRCLGGTRRIEEISSSPGLQFRYQRIGPLRPHGDPACRNTQVGPAQSVLAPNPSLQQTPPRVAFNSGTILVSFGLDAVPVVQAAPGGRQSLPRARTSLKDSR